MAKKKSSKTKNQKTQTKTTNLDKTNIYWYVSAIVAILIIASVLIYQVTKGGSYNGEKAKLDFYVMSQCPYGTEVEDAIKPVLDKFGNAINFNLNFIATETSPGIFNSLHGQKEVSGNIAQLCAAKYNPEKYMDMIVCMNKDASNIPTNWETCAKGLNIEKIKSCYIGQEGKDLLSESIKKSNLVQPQGSPTIYLNDKEYTGNGRDTLAFTRLVCSKLKGHPECNDIPECIADTDCTAESSKIGVCKNPNKKEAKCEYIEPVKFEVIIISDKNCKDECNPTNIVSATRNIFKGATFRLVDVTTDEGKALVKDLKLTVIPSYIFNKNVINTYEYKATPELATIFEQAGENLRLKDEITGVTHFVSEELRIEFLKSVNITLGDNKPQIDFFVMSYCPGGNQAEEAIEPAYQLLKNKAEFNPHYVIYSGYQGGSAQYCMGNGKYCSMHGIQEVHQDIREICVNKYLGTSNWFKFAIQMNKDCTANNADSCWDGVAVKLGLDKSKINTCFTNEGISLLENEVRLNALLKITASPSIFIDGTKYAGSRVSEGIKTGLCGAYTLQPAECQTSLGTAITAGSSTPSAGGCGA